MDRLRTLSPALATSPSKVRGRLQCGDSRTAAIRQSYDFHPKTAALWTSMAVFTLGFWGSLGWLILR